jgi:hypothetical protein
MRDDGSKSPGLLPCCVRDQMLLSMVASPYKVLSHCVSSCISSGSSSGHELLP